MMARTASTIPAITMNHPANHAIVETVHQP